tara:strand:+ start:295 stop:867 length:573 start_codon:yes stop_codon:yes gene_type:complete
MAKKKNFKVTTPMPPLPELLGGTELSLFDQTNNDINLFNLVDDEIIRLGGSELLYYKFRSMSEYDEVYKESREKVIDTDPIVVHGHYNPTVLEESLSEFGIELVNDQLFIFNKSYIEQTLHRIPVAGDIVEPKFQSQKYEIFEVQEDSFEIYGVFHLACSARLLRDSREVVNENLPDRSNDLGGYLDVES